jgi:hypothetical protein
MKVSWNTSPYWDLGPTAQSQFYNGSRNSVVTNDPGAAAAATQWIHVEQPVTLVASGNNSLYIDYGYTIWAQWMFVGIDNISLTPEPASLSILALSGLFLRRRRMA